MGDAFYTADIMGHMFRKNSFYVFAGFFAFAAAYHAVGFVAPELVIPSAHWRHGLFVIINVLGARLILSRPPWLILPFTVITLQQLYSHGTRAVVWWHMEHRVDWISLCVIILLPIALVLIVRELRERAPQSQDP